MWEIIKSIHFLYHITADVTPVDDEPGPTVNFSIVWIVVGSVALLLVVLMVCLCGLLCLRRWKKHTLDTGIFAS